MRKISIFMFLLCSMRISSQEYLSIDTVNNIALNIDSYRVKLFSLLPVQNPWESDDEYKMRLIKEYSENTELLTALNEFVYINYISLEKSYVIDTNASIISPNEFDRVKKEWEFNVDVKSNVLPNYFRVIIDLTNSKNIADDYNNILKLINNNYYNLYITVDVAHYFFSPLLKYLKRLGIIYTEKSSIISILQSISNNPDKYLSSTETNVDFIKKISNIFLNHILTNDYIDNKYCIEINSIKIFDKNVIISGYPDEPISVFSTFNPYEILPLKSER